MTPLPIPARSTSTIAQEVGDEFVVLNIATSEVHDLAGESAQVWRSAGTTTHVNPDAVAALIDLGLLDAPAGVTRRSMITRVGFVAAGVGIASVGLPMLDAAASGITGSPSITLSPSTGPRGTTVTVAGTNFYPSGTITSVTIGGITVTPSNTTISSTGQASFTFVVPAGAAVGADSVQVTDNHNNTASATFTVTTPTLTLTPSSAIDGATTTLSGTGYGPSGTYTVKLDGTTIAVAGNTGISAGGVINGSPTITVPNGTASGPHTVTVTDSFGNVGTATLTVPAPTVSLSRTSFTKNSSPQSVTVTGSGFFPGAVVTITNTGTDTFAPTPPTLTADGNGNISGSVSLAFATGSGRTGTLKFTDTKGNTASVNVTTT